MRANGSTKGRHHVPRQKRQQRGRPYYQGQPAGEQAWQRGPLGRRFAQLMGLPAARAEEIFRGFAAAGMQCDERGNIVGAALSIRETPHRVRVSGKDLFAWCSLDTLFIPGLLGETAEVESTCPSSGELIRLTIAPERIEKCDPAEAWLSIFLPGGSANPIGPASPT